MEPAAVSALDDQRVPELGGGRSSDQPLWQCVEATVRRYLDELGNSAPTNLYQLVLEQIEKPLLTVVMARARGNQCRAADMLGINRNTLRKKLHQYNL